MNQYFGLNDLIKQIVLQTGFKPPFISKFSNKQEKLQKVLKQKFPYLKNTETYMLAKMIDDDEEKDLVYESFGLSIPKKKKQTKKDKQDKPPSEDKKYTLKDLYRTITDKESI